MRTLQRTSGSKMLGNVSILVPPTDLRYPASVEGYTAFDRIGTGAFARVYRGKTKLTNLPIAIKMVELSRVPDDKTMKAVIGECEILAKLSHPNIVKIHAAFLQKQAKRIAMIMELVRGCTLEEAIAHRFGKEKLLFPERTIWKIFMYITSDLKTANVMVDVKTHAVKIIDLGLSRLKSEYTNVAHTIVGTPYYTAPEMMNGTGYSFDTDVWSLGCILYEMAMGTSPFQCELESINSLRCKIGEADYPPMHSAYSPMVEGVVKCCLIADPEHRIKTETLEEYTTEVVRLYAKDTEVPLGMNEVDNALSSLTPPLTPFKHTA